MLRNGTDAKKALYERSITFVLKFFIAVFIFTNSILSISAQPGVKSILFTQSEQSVKVEQGKTQSSLEYFPNE